MGWFKGRTVLTASAVFNLAGKLQERPDFRKTTVIGAVLNGSDSIGRSLAKAYLSGPGSNLKRFHRWALQNYQDIGVPGSVKLTLRKALPSHIRPEIYTLTLRSDIRVTGIQFKEAEYGFWVEKELLENFRAKLDDPWTAEIDETTNLITVNFFDGTTHQFTPTNFEQGATYIYASYSYTDVGGTMGQGMFIYKIGSGNSTLDALYEEETNLNEAFLAPIPMRLDNQFISDTHEPLMYDLAKKACKKALGFSLNELQDELAKSDDLNDMDYAYVVFGAPANTKEQPALRYIYEFLDSYAAEELGSDTEYTSWVSDTVGSISDQNAWKSTYETYPGEDDVNNPDPQPYDPNDLPPEGPPSRPTRRIKIENPGGNTNYDVRIEWSSISRQTGTGLAKVGAEVGEYWFSDGTDDVAELNPFLSSRSNVALGAEPTDEVIKTVYLYHQIDANNWEALQIRGMKQKTYVFGNNYEEINLGDAIFDDPAFPDKESSFLFPIRYSDFASLPLSEATQFALSCSFIQVHAYEIHIQRIYETPAFFVSLLVVVVVITFATGGFGASGVGVLGTNAAVGAALGFTGSAAILAGVVANAIAAMILTSLINRAATEAFGAKWGTIIGFVFSTLTINALSNMAAGKGFMLNFADMGKAENLLKLTSSVGNAYASFIQADTMEIIQETRELQQEYVEESRRIEELYAENIGYGNTIINPLDFVDASTFYVEPSSAYLSRTLMTGSDIAELSMSMVSNFADFTISTDLPI